MAPCLKPRQVAHPHFSQGETAGRDGQGRPRGLRSRTSWPRTHDPCAESDLAASPSRARLGQERAHSQAWQGEHQLRGYRKAGPPATSRQLPPTSYLPLVSVRLKVEEAASRERRSAPPLSDPRINGFSDRSMLCQSTLSPPRSSRRTLHWLHHYRPPIRFSSWIG